MSSARPIASGVLVVLGLALVANRCGSSRLEDAGAATPSALRDAPARPRLVSLSGATLDWSARRFRSHKSTALYAHDPRDVAIVADPHELFARKDELTGRFVHVTSAPAPATWLFLEKRTHRAGFGERSATSVYTPVEGEGGKVWIVSEPITAEGDPRSKEFLARRSHVGVVKPLADVHDPSAIATELQKRGGHAPPIPTIPSDAIALDSEKPPPPAAAVDVWAPVAGTHGELWVIVAGTPDAPPPALAGVVERVQDPALDRENPENHGTRRVLWLGDAETFRATHRDYERVSVIGLVLLAAGLGLLLAHLLLRRIT